LRIGILTGKCPWRKKKRASGQKKRLATEFDEVENPKHGTQEKDKICVW
jgi:hypothetical protein